MEAQKLQEFVLQRQLVSRQGKDATTAPCDSMAVACIRKRKEFATWLIRSNSKANCQPSTVFAANVDLL